jgi:hypothetical protein
MNPGRPSLLTTAIRRIVAEEIQREVIGPLAQLGKVKRGPKRAYHRHHEEEAETTRARRRA